MRKLFQGAFLFSALVGLASLASVFSTPSETTVPLVFGISALRLVIAVIFLVFSLLAVIILAYSFRSPEHFNQRLSHFLRLINRPAQWTICGTISSALLLTCLYLLTLKPEVQEPFTRAYFARASPAVIWLALISASALLLLLIIRFNVKPFPWLPKGKSFYIPLLIFAIFFIGWVFIARPRLPIETRITGWNITSAPILDTQMLLAWGAGAFMIAGWFTLLKKYPGISKTRLNFIRNIDFLIFIGFWITSALLWQSIPIQPSWFISEPVPPNQEFYPTSDARIYDIAAQTALVGSGFTFFDSPFIRRPFHAAYLTILRFVAGQNYISVVTIQIIFLALLPPFIYLLAKSLHDRPAGVIAALLVMLREANSISISGRITTSNAKELLVDLPTTLGMVIFTLIIIQWLKRYNLKKEYALIAGGVLGLVMLVRLEMAVAFIIIAVVAFSISRTLKTPRSWLKTMLLFILGVSVVILPWIFRNWTFTGKFFLDSPLWRADLLQQRFQPTPGPTVTNIVEAPASTPSPTQPSPILVQDTQTPSSIQPTSQPESTKFASETSRVLRFVAANPAQVAGFIATHYLNSQMQSFLILPTSFRLLDSTTAFLGHHSFERLWYQCCSAIEYIRRMPYWHKWDGSIPSQAVLPLIINTLLITLGIHISWKNHHLAGMVPGLIATAHFLLNALFRNSGGRYILPVDWVGIVYFSIGLSYITTRFLKNFFDTTGSDEWDKDQKARFSDTSENSIALKSPLIFAFAGIFLILGLTIPVTEIIFKPNFLEARQEQLFESFLESPLLTSQEKNFITDFISQGGEYLVGKGLYPEFLPGNSGEVAKYKYNPAPYPRLSFYLAGPMSKTILMPVRKRIKFFPNAAEVIVLGCPIITTPQGARQLDVLMVGIFNASGSLEAVIPRFPAAVEPRCPLPLPVTPTSESAP